MIEGIVKKIMLTGIEKYAKILETSPENIQIRITDDENSSVNFEICKEFKIVQKVSFLQIMDKKFDLLQYENLASPYLKLSLKNQAEATNDSLENICAFILKHNEILMVCFYSKNVNTKTVSLSKFLEELGLS